MADDILLLNYAAQTMPKVKRWMARREAATIPTDDLLRLFAETFQTSYSFDFFHSFIAYQDEFRAAFGKQGLNIKGGEWGYAPGDERPGAWMIDAAVGGAIPHLEKHLERRGGSVVPTRDMISCIAAGFGEEFSVEIYFGLCAYQAQVASALARRGFKRDNTIQAWVRQS